MKLLQNRFYNAVDIRQYVMIPEADDAKSESFDFCGSLFVSDDPFGVLPAIQLDNQARLKRGKISDITSDRDLSSKFVTLQSASAQMFPEQLLCLGFVSAKLARESDCQLRTPSPCPLPHGERV
jgi:hypothetical protein